MISWWGRTLSMQCKQCSNSFIKVLYEWHFPCWRSCLDFHHSHSEHLQLLCDSAKIFLPSKFIYLFIPTPPIKLKLGLQIGGSLLIANHLDQSLWLANQKQGAAVGSYLLHSSLAGVRLCCAFYQPQQTVQKCWAKTILLSQTGMFWLFFIQFYLQGHMLSTAGDALRHIWLKLYCTV